MSKSLIYSSAAGLGAAVVARDDNSIFALVLYGFSLAGRDLVMPVTGADGSGNFDLTRRYAENHGWPRPATRSEQVGFCHAALSADRSTLTVEYTVETAKLDLDPQFFSPTPPAEITGTITLHLLEGPEG
jgi:hypothetical protein